MPLEPPTSLKAILWDMDGTLINSEPLWVEAECELMASFDTTWDEIDQKNCLGGPMPRVGTYMAKKTNNRESAEYFAVELISKMEQKLSKGVAYAGGAKELFDECFTNKISMALVTASSRVLVNAAIASIGFERFVATISSDDVKESKPSPEGYLKAAEVIGVKISECLILEDSYVGVSAAIASGAVVIGISLSGELPKSSKLHVVPSLSNIGLPQLHEIYSRLVNA